jgi:hypothetical protein
MKQLTASLPPSLPVQLPCCCCRELGRLLRVNVMGYDYTGYGVCSGQPSIAATCCDISALLQSLEADHGVKRHTVVLYGQSVGSGPTVSCLVSRCIRLLCTLRKAMVCASHVCM